MIPAHSAPSRSSIAKPGRPISSTARPTAGLRRERTDVNDDFDVPDHRLLGLHIGHVVDRADPLKLGRVRVRIPGLIQDASAWAFPLGTLGGGSDRRGFFAVPEDGAEVGVLFHEGDVDRPWYLAGHWGLPGGATEIPGPARELSKTETPQIRALETRRFVLAFDDRAGHEALRIEDKLS